MKQNKVRRFWLSCLGLALSLIILVPFYTIIINSFKNTREAAQVNLSLPTQWCILENYAEMFQQGRLGSAFRNSVLLTVPCVLAVIALSSVSAFILQRRHSRASSTLSTFIVLGLFIPAQIIPTYFICYYMHLSSFLAAGLVLCAANIPMSVFLYMGYYKSIPRELDESAMLDGCGCVRMFVSVIFPLLKPITVTVFILVFMAVWNDLGTTIYFLNNSSNFTLTLTVYNFFGVHSAEWNLVFANVLAVSAPVVLIYFFAQKQIISGMTAGAVKG